MQYPVDAFSSVSAEPRHPTTDPGFQRLLAAARAGDRGAWREIYDALAPAVLGYVRARGASDPEDLTGEVFVQVVRDLASFEGGAAGFRAWVFTIAHHRFRRVTDLLRSLSPDQRDVLLLRIVGDLSLEEAARVTGKRTGAVKQLQRRGLAAIRRQLEREGVIQ
jgi:DNA-directed RNA polymerase specialized sigma24 family protein